MAARPPQAAGKVKYGYVIITATVHSQRDMTRLVQLSFSFIPGQQQTALENAVGVCTEAWPAVRDAHASCHIFA